MASRAIDALSQILGDNRYFLGATALRCGRHGVRFVAGVPGTALRFTGRDR